jgi:hypothetical protein
VRRRICLRWANSISIFFRQRQASTYCGVAVSARATSRASSFRSRGILRARAFRFGCSLAGSARHRRTTAVLRAQRSTDPDVKRWQQAIRKDGSLDQRCRLHSARTAPIFPYYKLKVPQCSQRTPDLIQALVQEGTGIHADVFKRVNAAYPYGIRLWDGDTGTSRASPPAQDASAMFCLAT